MVRVADLTAFEAATMARKILYTTFQLNAPRKYLYHALTKDKFCPLAQLVLIDVLENDTTDEIAITVGNHAYQMVKDPEIKDRMTMQRRVTLKRLNLLQVPPEDSQKLTNSEFSHLWQHSPDFIEDTEGLTKILNKTLGGRTPEQAYDAACLLVGVRAGLMVPARTTQKEISFADCFEPNDFRLCDDYDQILAREYLD